MRSFLVRAAENARDPAWVAHFELTSRRVSQLTVFLSISVIGVCIIVGLWRLTTYFNQTPYDGVFQTLFPLREMEVGNYPGRDFFYFHGNGIPYLIYPVYKFFLIMFPGEIRASILASSLISAAALYLPFFYAVSIFSNARFALVSTAAFTLVFENLPAFGTMFSPFFVGAPMGLRMLPHMLVALCVALFLVRSDFRSSSRRETATLSVIGLIAATGPLFGAEQGLYAAAAGAATLFLVTEKGAGFLRRIFRAAVYSIAFIVGLLGYLFILFGSLDTLRDIQTISANQVWVYGVFPNPFFESISEIISFRTFSLFLSQAMTIVGFISIIVTIIMFRLRLLHVAQVALLSCLFIGGLLSWASNFGYIGQHQAPLLLRQATLTGIYLIPPIILFLSCLAVTRGNFQTATRRFLANSRQ